MTRLITELQNDHAVIERMLERVRDSAISTTEAHRILIAAKDHMINHLKKEDAELYPALKKASLNNQRLKTTIDFYAKEMEEITVSVQRFYEVYSHREVDIEFAKEFGKLFAMLSRRLRSEENTLYKEYEKLFL